MIRGIVFDMDGLLFDSERVVKRSWDMAGDELGIVHMGSHIYHTLGMNLAGRTAYFTKAVGENFPHEEFFALTRRYFYKIVDLEGLSLKPGARELLEYGKESGYKMAVAISSRSGYALQSLKTAGIYSYFDGLVFGDMVSRSKPDPEIYLRACESIGIRPKECIALEDAPAGIRAAWAAGMKPVMIPDLVEPDEAVKTLVCRRFDTLHEVIPYLSSGV